MCRIFREYGEIRAVRGSAIRPLLWRSGKTQGKLHRSKDIPQNRHLIGAIRRNFLRRGSAPDCVESSDHPEKYRLFSDPPSVRFCGEWARFREIPRSAETPRNRHLLGEVGRDFATRGSMVDFGAPSGNRERSRRLADPPPARLCGNYSRFGEGRPRVGRDSAISPLTWGGAAKLRASFIFGRLRRTIRESRGDLSGLRNLRPVGSAAKGRDSGGSPPDR